jgi:hypothetical protein
MAYTKTIVCFANSRKLNGRCVAGREWDGNKFGAWIRPISSAEKGELYGERYYESGDDPQLLDVIEVPLLNPQPSTYQSENHVVDAKKRWRRVDALNASQVIGAVEEIKGPLWLDGSSTGNGENDTVAQDAAAGLPNSLVLMRPERLMMTIDTEGAAFGNARRRVRGNFTLNGRNYVLAVTDPRVERELKKEEDGSSRELKNPALCISLSEIFEKQNACYKLIAGVIET